MHLHGRMARASISSRPLLVLLGEHAAENIKEALITLRCLGKHRDPDTSHSSLLHLFCFVLPDARRACFGARVGKTCKACLSCPIIFGRSVLAWPLDRVSVIVSAHALGVARLRTLRSTASVKVRNSGFRISGARHRVISTPRRYDYSNGWAKNHCHVNVG